MPQEIEINKDRLRELASDPKNGIEDICAGLGVSNPTFYQQLSRHPDLKQIYQEARDQVRAARNEQGTKPPRASGRKPSGKRKPSKRQSAKSGKSSTPPQGRCQRGPQRAFQKAAA